MSLLLRPALPMFEFAIHRAQAWPAVESHQTCEACGKLLSAEMFHVEPSMKNFRRSVCKPCRAVADRERRLEVNPGVEAYRRLCRKYGLPIVVVPFTRSELIAAYGDGCCSCDGRFEIVRHRLCVQMGGEHSLANVLPSCRSCKAKIEISETFELFALRYEKIEWSRRQRRVAENEARDLREREEFHALLRQTQGELRAVFTRLRSFA